MALNAFSFRIRGRITRLMHLYRLFVEKPDTGLHPAQLARAARMSILDCLLYTSPSPRDLSTSRMPSSA